MIRKTKEYMRQGNIQMAEEAFRKVEQLNTDTEPELSESLLGTDLFILKGDKENVLRNTF